MRPSRPPPGRGPDHAEIRAVAIARAAFTAVHDPTMRRILIAEGHPVARRGYRPLLEPEFSAVEFVEVASRHELLAVPVDVPWDLVLLDLNLPDRPGVGVLREVRERLPGVPVLIVSSYPEDVYASEALRAGADGFVSKASSAEALLQAVRQVLGGRRYVSPAVAEQLLDRSGSRWEPLHHQLSPREREVFRELAVGESITVIALRLGLSVKTVSTYRARILEKMGMSCNADITAYSIRLGLEDPDGRDPPDDGAP